MLGTVGENCSLEYAREARGAAGDRRARRRPRAGADAASPNTRPRWPAGSPPTPSRIGRRRPDGPAGDGLQVRPARDDRPLPRGRPGDRPADHGLQQPGLLRRRHHARDVRRPGRRAAGSWRSRNRRRTSGGSPTCKNVCGDRYIAVLRRRRPGAGEPPAGRDGLGLGAGQRLPGREPAAVGPGHAPAAGRRRARSIAGTRRCCTWTRTSSSCSTSSWPSRNAGSAPRWSVRRGCRWTGEERERDPRDHPRAIATRPSDRRPGERRPASSRRSAIGHA